MNGCMPKFRLLCFLLIFLGGAKVAPGWDAGGHEVIATIADGLLNPKARAAVNELAQQIPSANLPPYNAITLACWMDDLRKDNGLPEHGLFLTWHYIDIGTEPGDPVPSFTPGDDNEFHGNVVQALQRAFVVLRGGTDPYIKTKAMACAMAMHLVGDIHQPLHAATHYFQTPGGWRHHDAGGNKEYVVNGPENDPRFSLHNFWDAAWHASFAPATGRVVLDSYDVPTIAQTLAQSPPPHADLEPHFEEWARESNQLAQNFVYREITATESKKDCRLSSGYIARARALARQRLLLAAYRLAALLNETLGASAPLPPPLAYPAGPAHDGY